LIEEKLKLHACPCVNVILCFLSCITESLLGYLEVDNFTFLINFALNTSYATGVQNSKCTYKSSRNVQSFLHICTLVSTNALSRIWAVRHVTRMLNC